MLIFLLSFCNMNLYRRPSLVRMALVAVVFLGAAGAESAELYSHLVLGGFSHDGSKLSLKACAKKSGCKMGYIELGTTRFVALASDDSDQILEPGGFSFDGSLMAISIRRMSENGHHSQVGMLSLPTNRVTQLTSTAAYSTAPTFSADAKKIIFARANRERTSGATRFADWDVYEVSIDGKVERRLTAHRFYQISPPSYMSGDRHFIFSGDSPRDYLALSGLDAIKAYKAKYADNRIFALPTNSDSHQLEPLFVKDSFSAAPSVSKDGSKILYVARTDKEDGVKTKHVYDIFLFDGKEHRRMSRIGRGQVVNPVLSPNGDRAAFVVMGESREEELQLYLLDITSGRLTPISLAI